MKKRDKGEGTQREAIIVTEGDSRVGGEGERKEGSKAAIGGRKKKGFHEKKKPSGGKREVMTLMEIVPE